MALISAVVPTLGVDCELLVRCLAALRQQGEDLEIILVEQGRQAIPLSEGLIDRRLAVGRPLGFAASTNRGIEAARGELIATVNDDLVMAPGWLATVRAALTARPEIAAAQGVNLDLGDPGRVDGWGIGWNRRLEAIQLGHGGPPPPPVGPPFEIFGASATAALFRREALARVALPGGDVFDRRLSSYYEDVDLAIRLRAAGYRAVCAPGARAGHAGSATSRKMAVRRSLWLIANRHLILARCLGWGFWLRWPRLLSRDALNALRALSQGDAAPMLATPLAWARAVRWLPAFARAGAPLLELPVEPGASPGAP